MSTKTVALIAFCHVCNRPENDICYDPAYLLAGRIKQINTTRLQTKNRFSGIPEINEDKKKMKFAFVKPEGAIGFGTEMSDAPEDAIVFADNSFDYPELSDEDFIEEIKSKAQLGEDGTTWFVPGVLDASPGHERVLAFGRWKNEALPRGSCFMIGGLGPTPKSAMH